MENKISADKKVVNQEVDLKKDLDKNLHVEEPILKRILIDLCCFQFNMLIYGRWRKARG